MGKFQKAEGAKFLRPSRELEDHFDFDGDVARERAQADGAAGADAVFRSPDFGEEFAAAVDHFRVVKKIRRGVHHAKDFDHALHAIERAEVRAQRGEDREADLAGGGVALSEIEFGADPTAFR